MRKAASSFLAAMALVIAHLFAPSQLLSVQAQDVVVDGTNETVIGNGGSGTQGSVWNIPGTIRLGQSAPTTTLSISSGGLVTSALGSVSDAVGSDATVTVDGAGSRWANTGWLVVGAYGAGTLVVSSGAVVDTGDTIAGFLSDAEGTITVTGIGSRLNVAGNALQIGSIGRASLNVTDGAVVNGIEVTVGQNFGSKGSVTVSGAGSLLNANVLLAIGFMGEGSLTIADGGVVSAPMNVLVADNPLAVGTLNIGAAATDPAAPAGVLSASFARFGAGTGKIVFNHTDTNYTFSPAITEAGTGTGSVEVLSGTTILTGANTFTGPTNISGGQLIVNSTLGAVTLAGGTLGGTGTVGPVTATSGRVAPGNSIGTLNVNGDVSFATGSIYSVELDELGNADQLAATGTITLNTGARLEIVADSGSYATPTNYIILTATSGVTGTFGTVDAKFAFLDASLAYASNNVTLTLVQNQKSFSSVAATVNQRSVASALDSMPFGAPIRDAVTVLSEEDARAAFDDLSGDAHRSVSNVMIQNTGHVRIAALSRLRGTLDASASDEQVLVAFHGKGDSPGMRAQLNGWGTAYGNWGSIDSDGNAAQMDMRSGGLVAGLDVELDSGWHAGILAGFGQRGLQASDRAFSGSASTYTVGAYGGRRFDAMGVKLGASASLDDVATRRDARVGSLSSRLKADYLSSTAQAFAEVAYEFVTPFARFEPLAGASIIHHYTPKFREGGGDMALTSAARSDLLGVAVLGLAADHRVDFEDGSAYTLSGAVNWEHAIGDLNRPATMRFASGDAFKVYGVPAGRDAFQLAAEFSLDLPGSAQVDVTYDGRFSAYSRQHGLSAKVSASF